MAEQRDYDRLQLTHQVEHDGLTGGLFTARVYVEAAAATREPIQALLERLREQLPAPDPSSAHEVTVTFWTYGPHGPMPSWRSIAVPSWDEIRDNYAARTGAGLEGLMHDWQPAHGGQLVLWHGAAGTGKTFGLRALAWQWREWCDFHYIVDPDAFFGQHADYLMSVLLQPEYMGTMVPSAHGFIGSVRIHAGIVEDGHAAEDGGEAGEGGGKAWRVLILGASDCRCAHGDRPGVVALPQRGRWADRSGLARARPRDDERADPEAAPRGRAAGPLRCQHRVRAADQGGGLLLARGARAQHGQRRLGDVGRVVRPARRPAGGGIARASGVRRPRLVLTCGGSGCGVVGRG